MNEFLTSLGVAFVIAIGGFFAKQFWNWWNRITLTVDDWNIGVNKDSNHRSSEFFVINSSVPGWVSYFATLKFVNAKARPVNLHHFAVEFRVGKRVVYRDDSAISPANLDLPHRQTVTVELNGQYENVEELRNCDSVWLVADEIGGKRHRWRIAKGGVPMF